MMDTKHPDYLRYKLEEMRTERSNHESRWQSISDHQLARGSFTAKPTQGFKDGFIYDGTSSDAWFMLTNAIQSILFDVESPWVWLDVYDSDESDLSDEELLWLRRAEESLRFTFRNSDGVFPTQANETLGDVCAFGNGGLHEYYDPRFGQVVFSSRPLQELYVSVDARNIVDTIYRVFEITVAQAKRYWGAKLPAEVIEFMDRKNDGDKFCFVNAHQPSAKGNGYDCFTFMEERPILFEEYHSETLPIQFPRWRTDAGQTYGTGPGVIADPFARTLNLIVKDWLTNARLQIAPPVVVADDGIIQGPSLIPNAVNVVSSYFPGNRDPIEAINLGGNFNVANEEIVRLQNSIRRAYLHDILQITDQKELTAFHVQELVTRSQQWAAPVFARLKIELVEPMVERTIRLMLRYNKLPKMPDSLKERGVKIQYVSPAQKAAEIQMVENTMKAVERNIAMSEVWPEILDNYDPDLLARHSHMGFAADPAVIRSSKDVRKLREQRAADQEAIAQQQGAQDAMAVGAAAGGMPDVAKVLGELRR